MIDILFEKLPTGGTMFKKSTLRKNLHTSLILSVLSFGTNAIAEDEVRISESTIKAAYNLNLCQYSGHMVTKSVRSLQHKERDVGISLNPDHIEILSLLPTSVELQGSSYVSTKDAKSIIQSEGSLLQPLMNNCFNLVNTYHKVLLKRKRSFYE